MKLLVVDEAYPSDSNLYADVFVHLRVKRYLARGHNVRVAAGFAGQASIDRFDGVEVDRLAAIDDLGRMIADWRPDAVLIHFPTFPFILLFDRYPLQPIVAWVHGFEALGWYRRLFNLTGNWLDFARYIKGNLVQLHHFRKFVLRSNRGAPIHFNFVSRWMRRVAQADALVTATASSVIPNPIDDRVFEYRIKGPEQRLKVLVIRPFKGRKYATDIIHSAVRQLRTSGDFARFEYTFVGAGVEASPLGRDVGSQPNVRLVDCFLTQDEIAALHRDHGVFLCPTRQDAQGVSMCEAMASGLVPVSSNNTAIPEFVDDGQSGLLTDNEPSNVAAALVKLANDPALFARLSEGAARSIREKAGISRVIDRELELVEKVTSMRC